MRHCLIARAAATAGADRAGRLAPAGKRPVRPLPARAPERRRGRVRPPAPPTPCASSPSRDEPWAALGTRLAAELYGCVVLEDGVEDLAGQRDPLRLAGARTVRRTADRRPADGRPARRRSSSGAFRTRPGALVGVLQEFAGRGVNLSKIESRPRKQGLGRYVFFADLEGARDRARDRRRARRRASDRSRRSASSGATRPRHSQAARSGGRSAPVTLSASAVEAATARAVAPAAPAGSRGAQPGDSAGPTPVREGEASQPEGPARPARAAGPRRADSGRVLVLNASYEPLNVCTVRRAVVLVLKEKAELVEQASRTVRSESVTLPHPVVIRLVTYVSLPRDKRRRRITRRAVFARDSWTCQYCGTGDAPDRRPRGPAQPRRRDELGEHRHLLRALQPPQGQPHAGRDGHAAAQGAPRAGADRVHPRRRTRDPGDVEAVPGLGRRAKSGRRVADSSASAPSSSAPAPSASVAVR